jgi:hypothetical protein
VILDIIASVKGESQPKKARYGSGYPWLRHLSWWVNWREVE